MKNEYPIKLDMIRLSSRVEDRFFNSLVRTWVDFYADKTTLVTSFVGGLKVWESTRAKDYRYNFTHTDIYGNSFYFAYIHNSERMGNGLHNFVIEYNPNKVTGDFFNMVMDNFIRNTRREQVRQHTFVSCDICVDIPMNITNFIVKPNGKRNFAVFGNVNSDDKTYYYGKGSGRVKLYNKKRELIEKQGKYIEGELTRFEVSLDIKKEFGHISTYELVENLPSLYYFTFDMLMDAELKLLMLGLFQAPELLNQLTRRKKEKLEATLKDFMLFEFNSKEINQLLIDYIEKLK